MKIGVIGDTHLGGGYNLGKTDPKTQLNSRLLDVADTFDKIIDEFVNRGVKVVILTGDIFETKHPTSAQLNTFSKCAQRAINKQMEIIIVVGNHDQQRSISTTTLDIFDSLEIPGISIYNNFGVRQITDDNGKVVSFVFMPYRDRRMIGTKTVSEAIQSIQNELSSISSNLPRPKVAIGHFMIDKAITGENPDSFSINELILPLHMFVDFDTVIMGHVHKHMVVSESNPTIVYAGSMEKNTFGEKHHKKVSLILDTSCVSNVEILPSDTANLYEMNFDYTEGDKELEHLITDKIILDIGKFHLQNNLNEAIVKFGVKVKKNDLYHVNQDKIREFIMNKNVKHLMPMQVSSVSSRKLRNKKITESVEGKQAITTFINQLIESEQVKRKLIRAAYSIIEEVEGK